MIFIKLQLKWLAIMAIIAFNDESENTIQVAKYGVGSIMCELIGFKIYQVT